MTGIVEFLAARLRDDEYQAIGAAEAFGPDWIEIWSGTVDLTANLPDRQPADGHHWDAHVPTNDSGVSRHMVRHDPARVLRDVAAKRRVMERHTAGWRKRGACLGCNFGPQEDEFTEDVNECPELRDMASVYAEHPDYAPTWRIDT